MAYKDRVLCTRMDDSLYQDFARTQGILRIRRDSFAIRYILKVGIQTIKIVTEKGWLISENEGQQTLLDDLTEDQKAEFLKLIEQKLGENEVQRLRNLAKTYSTHNTK